MNAQTTIRAGLILALPALTFLAYLPALHAGYIWDDPEYVVRNPNLRDAAGLVRIWTDPHSNWQYYPAVFTTFWAEYQAWELNPLGYHLDNILLHGLGAVLLYLLLQRLKIPAAWLAAAIFALHPVQVESVAWITERKNVLSGVFYLAAMWVYFQDRRWSYWLAMALVACALLSKTVTATWPAAVLVIVWWQKGRLQRRDVFPMLPYFLAGFVLALLTAQIEARQVGAAGKDWDFSLADRSIIAGRAVWFYVAKTFWPSRLTFIYPRWDLQSHRTMQIALAIAAAATLLALIVFSRKIGRGPAAAGLLFAGTLLPALGFVNVYPMRYSFVADHFQYMAMIALIVPAAVLLQRAAGKWAVLVLLPLAVLTWRQSEIYHDPVTLWTDTVAKNGSWMPLINLGQSWQMEGRLDLAEQQYVAATKSDPNVADTWWKLGAFQAAHGRLAEGEVNLRRALAVDPSHFGARADLAEVLKQERQ